MKKISSIINRKKWGTIMINFKYPLEPADIFLEKKVGKERLRLLEKALRTIGGFKEGEDIQVVEEEYQEGNTLHEVNDLDGTSFKFYNFSTNDTREYKENYRLEMKRKNSPITFIYNFYGLEYDRFTVVGIRVSLSPNRAFTLENVGNHHDRLTIEEDEKRYSLVLHRDSEYEMIGSLENIMISLSEIETLNLESILRKLEMNQRLFTIHIDIEGNPRATIIFKEGKIASYSITEGNQEIKGILKGKISREVTKTETEENQENQIVREVDPLTKEQIRSDIKGLLKSL